MVLSLLLPMADGTRLAKIEETLKRLELSHELQQQAIHQQSQEHTTKMDLLSSKLDDILGNLSTKFQLLEDQYRSSNRSANTTVHLPYDTRISHTDTASSHNNAFRMKLDVPRFDGTDAHGWIFKANQFFTFHNTSDAQRLAISSFNMEGPALIWYQYMHNHGLILDWTGFCEALTLRFGTSMYDDPKGALAKLCQKGNVSEYQAQFEALSNQVQGLSEPFLVSFFVSGLKPEIKRELLVAQPKSLLQAMSLARLQEEKYSEMRSGWRGNVKPHPGPGLLALPPNPTASKVTFSPNT